MPPALVVTLAWFVVGALAIARINRGRSAADGAERWKKYWVYLLVVHVVLAAILSGARSFTSLAFAVAAAGLCELLAAARRLDLRRAFPGARALAVYGVLAIGFVLFARETRAERIVFVYVVVLTFDGFSQVTGQLVGRRRLAPRVSPGKTVEGVLGGMVMALVTALVLAPWMAIGRAEALGLAAVVALAGLGGDLAASHFKRSCGLKDYGRLLPGHGGILDRFDSFIAAGSVYWSVVGR
jgi:phosphatidate cytidylyltransferase